ncbi:immunoglobulin superfamily member 2 [Camelus ferus]|nr:immunoglobulin superfamily member 2 [Camelus ferus]
MDKSALSLQAYGIFVDVKKEKFLVVFNVLQCQAVHPSVNKHLTCCAEVPEPLSIKTESNGPVLQAKLTIGQREVTVQKGPLFRAEGYPVSIGCNVTGYQGPSEQHFQWSVYLPTAPAQEIQIISTLDATFSYAVYAQRVRSREIYVERVRGNSIFLHISKLQMKDSGEYECHTPNTDERYYGSYSAKTNLIVIPDTLSVAMTPQTLSKEEGEPLELTCEASKATAQHTHLSVTWYLMQDGERSQASKIISLSKDFMLIPGLSYTERFAAGDVRLDKLGVATFRLSIGRLRPADQGQLFCEATEWIQDPDETWTFITKKQTDQTTLRIQPAVRDFHVNITAESTVPEGKPLELICLVVGGGQNPQLQGTWFFNNIETARLDAGGVLGLKKDYQERANQGQLQVSKLSPRAFSLKIFSVGPEDEGAYRCAVAEVTRAQMGLWQVLQSKQSPDSLVHLRKPAARNVVVSTKNKQQAVWEGETLTLFCKADGAESPLSVTWWHIPQDQTQPEFVAGMGQDGTVQLGASYGELDNPSNTRLEKMDWASFQLKITSTTVTDSGTYECRVSERTRNQGRDLNWTQKISVTVKPLKSKLEVNSSSQVQEISINSNTDIECSILSQSTGNLQLAIIWYFHPISTDASWLKILEMDRTNVVKYGDKFQSPRRKQKFHAERVSQGLFQLHLLNVEDSDQGKYYCAVREWLRSANSTWHQLGEKQSGLTELKLRPTGSKVRVSKVYWTENATEHREAAIRCSLESAGSPASLFSATWYRNRGNPANEMLAHLQQDGSLEYGEEGLRRRLLSYRSSPTDFVLQFQRVEMEDAGMYWCKVAEWQLHGNPSKWVAQASDESQPVVLTVLPSEPTLPSRICSSAPLLYFLVICPFVMLFLLLISLLCLCWKSRKLSTLSLNAQKEKALWVGLKGAGGRTTNRMEEDDEDS